MPGWAVPSAVAGPVILLAGLVFAPMWQRHGYDSVRDTISSLAALDARGRMVMTVALVGLGLSYVATAIALAGGRLIGRLLLGTGGAATALVGFFPLPTGMGGSVPHAASALVAVVGITLWPLGLLVRRSHPTWEHRPFAARGRVAVFVTVAFVLLFAWFGLEQWTRWGHVGLSERVAALCQSIWPPVVVVTTRANQRRRLATARPPADVHDRRSVELPRNPG